MARSLLQFAWPPSGDDDSQLGLSVISQYRHRQVPDCKREYSRNYVIGKAMTLRFQIRLFCFSVA
jgi:hypothetical protein